MCRNFWGIRNGRFYCSEAAANGQCFCFAEVDLLVCAPHGGSSSFMWSISAYRPVLIYFVWNVTDVLRMSHFAPNSANSFDVWCYLFITVARWLHAMMPAVRCVSFRGNANTKIPLLNQFAVCWFVIYDFN